MTCWRRLERALAWACSLFCGCFLFVGLQADLLTDFGYWKSLGVAGLVLLLAVTALAAFLRIVAAALVSAVCFATFGLLFIFVDPFGAVVRLGVVWGAASGALVGTAIAGFKEAREWETRTERKTTGSSGAQRRPTLPSEVVPADAPSSEVTPAEIPSWHDGRGQATR